MTQKVYVLTLHFEGMQRIVGVFSNKENMELIAKEYDNEFSYNENLIDEYFNVKAEIERALFIEGKQPEVDFEYYKALEKNYENYLLNYSHYEYQQFEIE